MIGLVYSVTSSGLSKQKSVCVQGNSVKVTHIRSYVQCLCIGPILYICIQGCQPYVIAPCEHHTNGSRTPCEEGHDTPHCEKQCEKGYDVPYNKDKHFGKFQYSDYKHNMFVINAFHYNAHKQSLQIGFRLLRSMYFTLLF